MNPPDLILPTRLKTKRLLLRCYQAGDGPWYAAMSLRNKAHLARYEAGNAVMTINTAAEAERVMLDFANLWRERKAFFLGAFRQESLDFVAQIYIGVVSWDVPEFEIGYFADVDHEGQGYVREAVRGVLHFIFHELGAHRVRLECDDGNLRSWKVAERCGLVREGHVRENKRNADGSLSGTLHYGLLKSEYLQLEDAIREVDTLLG